MGAEGTTGFLWLSYGYKEQMIEVEYPVMAFPRKGYADLVVSIYHQGRQELKMHRSRLHRIGRRWRRCVTVW